MIASSSSVRRAEVSGVDFDRRVVLLADGALPEGGERSDRTVDSHIRHIRSKFAAVGCDEVIATVHGVGYRLGSTD